MRKFPWVLLLGSLLPGYAFCDAVERSFSPDPTVAAVCVSTGAGGDTFDRYEYRVFGDGKIEGRRFNGENRTVLNTWSNYLTHEELTQLERDVINSRLFEFDEAKQEAVIASRGPQPHTTDAPAVTITVTLLEGSKGAREEVSRSFSLNGGAGTAYKFKDVPEYGAAHRLLRLLARVKEPLAPAGS